MPQPFKIAGSNVLVNTGFAKFRLLTCAQKSPPDDRKSCTRRLLRSQSGLKLLFASVQVLVTLVVIRDSGLTSDPVIELPSAAARYFPTFTLTAVLPLPNTS